VEKGYTIEASIFDEGLKANIKITPMGEQIHNIKPADLLKQINSAGITYGIMQDQLHRIVEQKLFNKWVRVATGQAPVHGKDGCLKFHFSSEGSPVNLTEDNSGRVNIKDMNLIQNVKKGDVLCELIPPDPGKNGISVEGKPIAAIEGKSEILPGGKNVEITQEGAVLVASIDGMVVRDGAKIHVEPILVVEKVNASTGNIRFNGTVIVTGEVSDGYEIHALEDVSIATSLGQVVISAGGSIAITGGIFGHKKGMLSAGNNITAKFIQDTSVEAKQNINVEDYILNSHVTAGGYVALKSGKGWIAGSTISSGLWIFAYAIGVEGTPPSTNLIIGHDPYLIEERERLSEDIFNKIKNFIKLQSSLKKLRKIQVKGSFNKQQQQLYTKILAAIDVLRSDLIETDSKIKEIIVRINTSYSGNVYIPGIIHQGTKIHIGNASKEIMQSISSKHYSLAEDEIIEAEFSMNPEISKYMERS